jgi:ATP-dependent RNA helicase DDX49/DBP8
MARSRQDSPSESENQASSSSSYDFDEQEELRDGRASRKKRKMSPQPEDDSDSELSRQPPNSQAKLSRVNTKRRAEKSVITKIDEPSRKEDHSTFSSLNVVPWLVHSLSSMAIRRPTGIQKGCIPEILAGRDCIGGSRTGSGKTVAFAVPILQKWAEDPVGIYAVVLTPTRYA